MTVCVLWKQHKSSCMIRLKKEPVFYICVEKGDLGGVVNFGMRSDADHWDLAECWLLYFVNILINILTSILQAPYGPNLWGQQRQHTNEREKETNHLIRYYNTNAPESTS